MADPAVGRAAAAGCAFPQPELEPEGRSSSAFFFPSGLDDKVHSGARGNTKCRRKEINTQNKNPG